MDGNRVQAATSLVDVIVTNEDLMNKLICGIIDRMKDEHDIRDSFTSAIIDAIEDSNWIEHDTTTTFDNRLRRTLTDIGPPVD